MYNIAIVGATGVVGRNLLELLEGASLDIKQLFLLASAKSAGKALTFLDQEYLVKDLNSFDFSGIDLVFGCAGTEASRNFVSRAVQAGAVVIDEASFLRTDNQIPLIVPEINKHLISQYNNKSIIASPNCCALPLAIVINELEKIGKIKRLVVSSYQACSGAGKKAVDELYASSKYEIEQLCSDELSIQNKTFGISSQPQASALPRSIGFNVIPQVGKFIENTDIDSMENISSNMHTIRSDLHTDEEAKVYFELSKILGRSIDLSFTAVRVPVVNVHSFSCSFEFCDAISANQVIEQLNLSDHINYCAEYFTPKEIDHKTQDKSHIDKGSDLVHASRVRGSISKNPKIIEMWVSCHNLRKGAALNLLHIAQQWIAYTKTNKPNFS